MSRPALPGNDRNARADQAIKSSDASDSPAAGSHDKQNKAEKRPPTDCYGWNAKKRPDGGMTLWRWKNGVLLRINSTKQHTWRASLRSHHGDFSHVNLGEFATCVAAQEAAIEALDWYCR